MKNPSLNVWTSLCHETWQEKKCQNQNLRELILTFIYPPVSDPEVPKFVFFRDTWGWQLFWVFESDIQKCMTLHGFDNFCIIKYCNEAGYSENSHQSQKMIFSTLPMMSFEFLDVIFGRKVLQNQNTYSKWVFTKSEKIFLTGSKFPLTCCSIMIFRKLSCQKLQNHDFDNWNRLHGTLFCYSASEYNHTQNVFLRNLRRYFWQWFEISVDLLQHYDFQKAFLPEITKSWFR